MNTSTIVRNIRILEEVLSGKMYADCAKNFNISVPSVINNIRSLLNLLKEHTDIELTESLSYSYLLEKKDTIKKYLAEPFPKTLITANAKSYLVKKFGKHYARQPDKVAAHWTEIVKDFNFYNQRRDILSIQNWLASEGYIVGNLVTNAMLDFAFSTMQEVLTNTKAKTDTHSFEIKKVERSSWQKKLIVQAEIAQRDHRVLCQFAIDVIPGQP